MSFFWRKNTSIPPVEPAGQASGNSSSPPPSASRSSSYPSVDNASTIRDNYSRNTNVGDVYTRGGANVDQDRNELFSGYNAQKSLGSGRFSDGPQGDFRNPPLGEENDDDVEGIKKQTRFIKQESLNSSRNALRLAREAEETARNTLNRLGDQSERLANTERHLDVAKGHSRRADDKTDELKQLNRSIFRPVIVFNKDKKRVAQESQIQARYEEERGEREQTMMRVRETQDRIGRAQGYGRSNGDEELLGTGASGRYRSAEQLAARKEQRKRFQFEATASDDELEDELDDNLDEIGDMTKRLKALGMTMNQELESQNKHIDNIEQKAVGLDARLFRNTERLKKIK
ncbi:protein transporter SEC9 [Lentinula aff. lateritia]|uniref:Protein transporter SEC9 n=1 Tax=Lentinula aff. lateritia TaxID=2804960 RepID=A0ACC1UBV7_9AGAR|nr:protein transporter SEC9 [Lentinula aff. lateritia]